MKKRTYILIFIILISCSFYPFCKSIKNYITTQNLIQNKYKILIDINEKKLYLINTYTEKVQKVYNVATGKPSTPSPIGTWTIVSKGKWGEGFGSRWMGFNVPWDTF